MRQNSAPFRFFKRQCELPGKRRLLFSVGISLLGGLWLTLVSVLITTQSIKITLSWLTGHTLAVLSCTLFLGLIIFTLGGLFRSLFASGLIVSLLVLLSSFVNYFKTFITTTPLFLSDIVLITKLGDIANLNSSSISFSRNSMLAIWAVLLWIAALFFISKMLRVDFRKSLISGAFGLFVLLLLFVARPVVNAWCYAPLGLPLERNYGQAYVNDRSGVPLGLWRSALGLLWDGAAFSDSDRDEMLSRAQSYIDDVEPGGSGVQPNVIMILSESFFDVTTLPGVEYDEDPIAGFRAIAAEGISGTFYTRTLGYGTCNIELELLTGINNRFLASDEMLSYWDPDAFGRLSTVPGIFSENGYYTAFLHTFDDSIYTRAPIYSRLGFNDIFFSGDFAEIDPEAAAAADYWEYMQGKISGGFYSDDYMTELLIKLYEEKSETAPVFLYGVTMENHTPYEAGKYDSYDFPFTSPLSAEGEGVLNAITQGAANSSKALCKLVEYFRDCPEPTIIVFYGDHRPGLPLESGGTIYSALGMCAEDSAGWSTEQTALLYSTDYLIWANDESLLPEKPGRRRDTSSNFLGLDTLRTAGIPLDPYWRMLDSMRGSSTAYMWSYFVSAEGVISPELPDSLSEAERQKFETMTWLLREAVAGGGERAAFYDLE